MKQCKGKDLLKVPDSKLGSLFYSSIKYDGHYIQIYKLGDRIRFFTSGGKEFYHKKIAYELLSVLKDEYNINLEGEFIADTEGKHGDRGRAAKLTTYRTNFNKGLINGDIENKDRVIIFDILTVKRIFNERLEKLNSIAFRDKAVLAKYSNRLLTLEECRIEARKAVDNGYEGLFLKEANHMQIPGKRVNNAIKLKLRPTADLLCIDTTPGEGKYLGMIGSLVLQDSEGRVVKVGSGLNDSERSSLHSKFIGNIIEIEYEQILDTYIQPVFISIRKDKNKED